jgi:methylenetetrahydrofolate reductase (NADPH)
MTESETRFQTRIRSGEPLLVVEIAPPKGGDPAPLRAAAKRYAGKVNAIGVSDNRHGVCMSALAAAAIVAAEGVEPILHLATRDRNRIALIASCLGAQALGVRNILCTSGTHQTLGICPPAKNVFDIDSTQLIEAIAHLGEIGDSYLFSPDNRDGSGQTHNGREIGNSPVFPDGAGPFCLGAVAAPFADPAELQLMRLSKKVAAGAQFLITQPVYDLDRFGAWWGQVTQRGIDKQAAILAGIQPLLDAKQAKAYAASRPFPMVPQALLDKLSSAGDRKAQRAAGIEIAVETVKQVSALNGVRGLCISFPSSTWERDERGEGDENAALEIIERSGLEAR